MSAGVEGVKTCKKRDRQQHTGNDVIYNRRAVEIGEKKSQMRRGR